MHYVVVGASAAGISGITELRKLNPTAKLTLVSTDEHIYSRCILHHYLEGIRDIKHLEFVEDEFIEKKNIHWLKGVSVVALDETQKLLSLSNHQTLSYDKLLLATGAHTFFPPITNLVGAVGVYGLRTLDDAKQIKEKAQQAKHIVVMGAGLVGIDALTGLLHYGKPLTLVEFKSHMLALQLDKEAARAYQEAFEKEGVTQYYDTAAQEVILDESGAIKQLALSNGEVLDCDFLIVATGVRASVSYLEGSQIQTDRFGLIFNEYGETSAPDVYGAGDVSGHNPIWPAAVKEGLIAASNMSGVRRELTDFFASKSTMSFLGVRSLSVGSYDVPDDSYTVEIQTDDIGNYKKIIHKDGVITGAIIQGDLAFAGVLTQLVRQKINIAQIKKSVFDINYADFFHITPDGNYKY